MTSLRQRMLEDMQIRNFSENARETYLQQVSLFARHFRRSPEDLGPANIRSYQVYLTNEKKLAVGSILIATSAMRFLYVHNMLVCVVLTFILTWLIAILLFAMYEESLNLFLRRQFLSKSRKESTRPAKTESAAR
jgi:Phage integrase, N-terminal SAM-like domain